MVRDDRAFRENMERAGYRWIICCHGEKPDPPLMALYTRIV